MSSPLTMPPPIPPRLYTPPSGGWGWSASAQRYMHNGRFVSPSQVRDALDAFIEGTGERLQTLTLDLQLGRLELMEWRAAFAQEIKAAHLASSVVGNGGWSQMTFSQWGKTGSLIKEQYAYLNGFTEQVLSGEQPLDGLGIMARTAMYGEAPRHSYEVMRLGSETDAGFDIEWNELGDGDSCDDCLEATDQGEVDTGTLTLPGERQCKTNCHCTIRRRRSADMGLDLSALDGDVGGEE